MTLYEKYKKLNIDTAKLGLEKGSERSSYFCTPIGAKVIGRPGVDGIHYCMIRDLGDMVFVVNPMSTPGDYVHPVAGSFEDFLRLLLACGEEAAIGQAYCWKQEQFDTFLKENAPGDEQKAVLQAIREAFDIEPMEKPFEYIRGIQEAFDYRKLRFKPDYFEWAPEEPRVPTAPEWKVYFHGNFRGRRKRERAGEEIHIGKQLIWGGEKCHIPAVYSCSAGLVLDFCVEVEPDRVMTFIDKWKLLNESEFTDEEREIIEAEYPLNIDVKAWAELNGTKLRGKGSCGMTWIPKLSEEMTQDLESRWLLEHYGLDLNKAWKIMRFKFEWATKRKPIIKSLNFKLKQRPVSVPGIHFFTPKNGESISFTNTATGEEHTLTVQETAQEQISHIRDEEYEYPANYIRMNYSISPDLPDSDFRIQDSARGDSPRRKITDKILPDGISAVSIGIIGGADGPTAIIFGGNSNKGKMRVACSSLHFEPVDSVEWRITFFEKRREDIEVKVI